MRPTTTTIAAVDAVGGARWSPRDASWGDVALPVTAVAQPRTGRCPSRSSPDAIHSRPTGDPHAIHTIERHPSSGMVSEEPGPPPTRSFFVPAATTHTEAPTAADAPPVALGSRSGGAGVIRAAFDHRGRRASKRPKLHHHRHDAPSVRFAHEDMRYRGACPGILSVDTSCPVSDSSSSAAPRPRTRRPEIPPHLRARRRSTLPRWSPSPR